MTRAEALVELRRQLPQAPPAKAPARPLSSGIDALDRALGGGLPRRAVVEVVGRAATALALAALARATANGEACAWIDGPDGFDAASACAAGADLARVIWVRAGPRAAKAADLVLEAGGFGLVVLDVRHERPALHAARLARRAETGGAAVLLLAAAPLCGTFAAVRLALGARPCWRGRLLDGLTAQVRIARARGRGEDAVVEHRFT